MNRTTGANIVLANIPPNIINFHYWLLMKKFLTFGFGESGGTSQVLGRYQQVDTNKTNENLNYMSKDAK